MSVHVVKPGMLSTFQDLGRTGSQHLGVPACGAMDSRSHRFANLLVGNTHDAPTLEVTLMGPTLRFEAACCLAICGADLSPALNGIPVLNHRTLIVHAGDELSFGPRRTGMRAYIAWHGGPALTPVLGSASTDLRGGFGGLEGRGLRAGDHFELNRTLDIAHLDEVQALNQALRLVLPAALVPAVAEQPIRLIPHPMMRLFDPEAWTRLTQDAFRIHAASDRMGYRLEGPELSLQDRTPLLSEGTSMGTIQVPPDGQPIILMPDRQTTGGYAKIASVASVDLPAIAQCMPGEALHFKSIDLEQAHTLLMHREAAFQRVAEQLTPTRDALEAARSR